jgi:hypothetical protein
LNSYWKTIGIGIAAVLVFDTLASLASVALHFPYAYASFGSVLIYASIGFTVFRRNGLGSAIVAALLVESVDATVGWGISWVIGPGAIQNGQANAIVIATTIGFVMLFAVACSLAGATASRIIQGPRR